MASRRAVLALSSITTMEPSVAFAVMSMKPEATERLVPPSMMSRPGSSCSMASRSAACRLRSSPMSRARPSSSSCGATGSGSARATSVYRYLQYKLTAVL